MNQCITAMIGANLKRILENLLKLTLIFARKVQIMQFYKNLVLFSIYFYL